MSGERATRVLLGAVGIFVIGYGCLRMWQQQRQALPGLARWLIGAVVVHDSIIAPAVIGCGWLIARWVPARYRAHVQGGLVTAALVGSVAFFLIMRQHKYSARSLALLRQNYLANAFTLLGLIAVGTVLAYLLSRFRATRRTKTRPPADH